MPDQIQCFMCGSLLPFRESECPRCADGYAPMGMPASKNLAPAEAAPASGAASGFHLVEDDVVFEVPRSESSIGAGAAPASAADFGFHLVDDGFVEEKPVYKSQLKRVDPARLRTRLVVEDDGVYDPYGNETERADASTPASYTYPEIYGSSPHHEASDSGSAPPDEDGAPAPGAAALSSVRIGPVFDQIDAHLDGRHSTWTDAQKADYLTSVIGTQVKWQGEVMEVSAEHGGRVTMKCNPETQGPDTVAELDGAQVARLARLTKHQRITVVGILSGHDENGYTVVEARVLNI